MSRCGTIELVFSKFRELGTARQVSLWFRQERIPVPRRRSPLADPVNFVPATTWRVTGLLQNPAYAGAYAFGRTRRRVVLIEGRKRQVKQRERRPDQWQVLLQDHHEGYITWPEYLANQERLEQNRSALGEAVSGAARPGKGLLAGLVHAAIADERCASGTAVVAVVTLRSCITIASRQSPRLSASRSAASSAV